MSRLYKHKPRLFHFLTPFVLWYWHNTFNFCRVTSFQFCLPLFLSRVLRKQKERKGSKTILWFDTVQSVYFAPLSNAPLAEGKKPSSHGSSPASTRFLPELCDPRPQPSLCFRDLSCCSSQGGKHIFRCNTHSSLALSTYTRQFWFMSLWIKEKGKTFWNACRESERQVDLVYCLGRRIPVVHILRFPALKPWYIFACLSSASLPGMCKYIWNERNDQKKKKKKQVFLRWEKVHFSPLWTWNISRIFIYFLFFGGGVVFLSPPCRKESISICGFCFFFRVHV